MLFGVQTTAELVNLEEVRSLQRRFGWLLTGARKYRHFRRSRESDDEYGFLLNAMEEIVALRQTRAEQEELGDLLHQNMVDHAEAIVRGVQAGYIHKPEPARILPNHIVGTCYPGESSHYYRDFTPKDPLDVELEFKTYARRGYRFSAIWVLPFYVDSKEVYYVVDGHGRSSLANCIGKPVYARVFR
ncbi:MAG: hypothetical protein AAB303_05575 [Chloroflexota bacterium]